MTGNTTKTLYDQCEDGILETDRRERRTFREGDLCKVVVEGKEIRKGAYGERVVRDKLRKTGVTDNGWGYGSEGWGEGPPE